MLQRLADALANYVIRQGAVDGKDHDLYSYGLLAVMEKGLVVLGSIAIAAVLGMYVECGIFFLVFVPLRTYAGGLHLEKFTACFALSCVVLASIMLLPKIIAVPPAVSMPVIFLLLLCVYAMYPVENANRALDEAEKRYFKSKLRLFLLADVALTVVFAPFRNDAYLETIMLTLLCVAITMKMGKMRNKAVNEAV